MKTVISSIVREKTRAALAFSPEPEHLAMNTPAPSPPSVPTVLIRYPSGITVMSADRASSPSFPETQIASTIGADWAKSMPSISGIIYRMLLRRIRPRSSFSLIISIPRSPLAIIFICFPEERLYFRAAFLPHSGWPLPDSSYPSWTNGSPVGRAPSW